MTRQSLLDALQRLPYVELGAYPTPLHRLPNYEKKLNYKGVFIKRDDLTGLGPGGNKARSLEYIIGDALAKGCDTLITAGTVQSNLCTLLACACARYNLHCVLVHNNDAPVQSTGNLLLNNLLNTESIFFGNITKYERNDSMQAVAEKLAAQGRKPYIVHNGATSGLGALGYVRAALEIEHQCRQLQLPVYTIFVPGGNGGVATGLIYGNALLGHPFRIVVISTEYEKARLEQHIQTVIAQIEEALHIPFSHGLADSCEVIDDYYGGGWGQPTPQSEEAVLDFPRTEGIFLDRIYMSKLWAGMQDMIKRGKTKGCVCLLHTGGFGSLFGKLD